MRQPPRLSVLALDYDGTIAWDGELDPDVRVAIAEARASGITVLIVTGRILSDLQRVAGDLRFVDAVVAENGAVVAFPATGRSIALAPTPPARLVDELRRCGVEAGLGTVVIEADAVDAAQILSVVRSLELPEVLIFNRDRVMLLPSGINKGTGLKNMLGRLHLSPHQTIGIGDAENDHELFDVCEKGVAVGWGSAALRARADEVIEGTGPAAVAAYIRAAISGRETEPRRASSLGTSV
jgi:hydroxymethylpyrimidine pyrophosphatase-like HAD family hydrolase